jgi:hypothetical protein
MMKISKINSKRFYPIKYSGLIYYDPGYMYLIDLTKVNNPKIPMNIKGYEDKIMFSYRLETKQIRIYYIVNKYLHSIEVLKNSEAIQNANKLYEIKNILLKYWKKNKYKHILKRKYFIILNILNNVVSRFSISIAIIIILIAIIRRWVINIFKKKRKL